MAPGDELTLTVRPLPRPPQQKVSSTARFIVHLLQQGLSVPFEDEHVAVVFKPPGIHTKRKSNPKFAALEDALPAVLHPSHGLLEDAFCRDASPRRARVRRRARRQEPTRRRRPRKQLEAACAPRRHALLVGGPADGLLEAP